jgi:site-specific DNA recombinase
MRAALYVRVSTDRQQQAQTIERQVVQLQSYVAAHDGWTVAAEHVFRDDGRSGARLDRPGLDALRDHAARAAFDLVVICSPDRLARNFVHQMVVMEELERRGVRVGFCDRPLSDDPHEQLVTQIRGAVAEYERTLIADRMRRGRLAKLRSGQLLPWTRAPYGYRLHPERPRDPAAVQIDPVAAVVVQELFAAYAAGGVTLHALAARLTRRRVPTPTGKPVWRPTTIRNLLTNPAYKGQAASGRLRTHSARRRKSALEPVGRGMSTRAHPPQEWITVPVPALVAAEQFDLVARRLASNQRAARRSTTHPYLLRGLVSCGICRLSGSGVTRTATDTRYRYYRCLGKMAKVSSGRSSCCPARFIPATQLDELVWADLCAVLQHPELVPQALERAHSGAWVPQELRRRQASLRGVRASVARQRRRLLEAYLAEVIDLACFQRQDQGLAGQEADLLAREREVAAQGERLVEVSAIAQSMTQVLKGLRVGLGQLPTASPAGGAVDRPGGGDRRSRGDPLCDPHHIKQHQDAVLSLAYRLFPDRTCGPTPARPCPGRVGRGRPTTAIAPWAAGSGRGRAGPGRAGWCRARSAVAGGCRGRGDGAAWDAARPRRARSRCRTSRLSFGCSAQPFRKARKSIVAMDIVSK